MRIHVDVFSGMQPRVDPYLLGNGQAQEAKNVRFESGALRPLQQPILANSPAGSSLDSIHYLDGTWIAFSDYINLVPAPVFNDENRFFYTGAGSPRKATKTGYTGTGAYFNMGVPKPTNTLTINYGTDPGQSEDPGNQAKVSYVYCYVTGWGEMGPPSDPTAIVDVQVGQYVYLTGRTFPASYATLYNIVGYRVFRINWGTLAVEYQELYSPEWADDANTGGHIDDAVTTVNDRTGSAYQLIDSKLLGGTLQSENWTPPPSGLSGLVALSNGVLAGYVGNKVMLTDPYLPFAWPHSLAIGADVVCLGHYDTTLVVITEKYLVLVNCYDPSAASPYFIDHPYPGASTRCACSGDGFVTFVSTFGLIHVSAAGVVNLTEQNKVFTLEQWEALSPQSLIIEYFDGRYYLFKWNQKTGFIIDFQSQLASYSTFELDEKTLDVKVTENGLFLLSQSDGGTYGIVEWDSDPAHILTMTFKSKKYQLSYPDNWAYGQVRGTFDSVLFKLYGDGTLIQTKTVTSEDEFLLVGDIKYDVIEFYVETDDTKVRSVTLAPTIEELEGV